MLTVLTSNNFKLCPDKPNPNPSTAAGFLCRIRQVAAINRKKQLRSYSRTFEGVAQTDLNSKNPIFFSSHPNFMLITKTSRLRSVSCCAKPRHPPRWVQMTAGTEGCGKSNGGVQRRATLRSALSAGEHRAVSKLRIIKWPLNPSCHSACCRRRFLITFIWFGLFN